MAFFHGERETEGYDGDDADDADDLLLRARNQTMRMKATSKSEICVGYGQGRATRELELIWWPSLYTSSHGKLTIRFYVQKLGL